MLQPIRRQKAGVIHQNHRIRVSLPQLLAQHLRPLDRVDDQSNAAALERLACRRKRLLLLHTLHTDISAAPLRRDGSHMYRLILRPAQQRIVLTRGDRRIYRLFLPEIGAQQFCPALPRECGRQQNNRHMISTQPVQHTIQIGIHIRIIGMALVQNNHLAGQAKLAQHHMFSVQRSHEQLIHRADHQICQQLRLSAAEEGMCLQRGGIRFALLDLHVPGFQTRKFRVQLCLTVRQFHCNSDRVRLMPRPLCHTGKHCIGRRLRREEKRSAAQAKTIHQNFCRSQCRFRLAVSHRRFKDHHARCFHRPCDLLHLLLDGICRKAEAPLKIVRRAPVGRDLPRPRQAQLLQRSLSAARVIPIRLRVHGDKWKISRVAGDPVCHDH